MHKLKEWPKFLALIASMVLLFAQMHTLGVRPKPFNVDPFKKREAGSTHYKETCGKLLSPQRLFSRNLMLEDSAVLFAAGLCCRIKVRLDLFQFLPGFEINSITPAIAGSFHLS